VSIALLPSNFDQLKFEYKALAPSFKLYDDFKKKKISEEKFIIHYKQQLSELNPNNVFEHINILTGEEEPVLMCHGPKTKFCYRHIVADWLEENLEIKINEFDRPNYIRKDGYLVKRKDPSLFEDED